MNEQSPDNSDLSFDGSSRWHATDFIHKSQSVLSWEAWEEQLEPCQVWETQSEVVIRDIRAGDWKLQIFNRKQALETGLVEYRGEES